MTEKEAGRESLSTSSFSKCSQRLRLTQATLKLLCKRACCLKLLERQKERDRSSATFFFLLLFKCLQQDKANAGAWNSVWVLIQMSCKDPSVHPLLLRPKVCGIRNGIRGAGVECCSFSVLEISTSHCGMLGFSSSHPATGPDSCSYIC